MKIYTILSLILITISGCSLNNQISVSEPSQEILESGSQIEPELVEPEPVEPVNQEKPELAEPDNFELSNNFEMPDNFEINDKPDNQEKENNSFGLQASLNSEEFKHGQEMQLSVKSSNDCYLTIFNISSNNSVYILLPNQFIGNNFLKAGETFLLPRPERKIMKISFQANLFAGKEKDTESIKIVATKNKIDFSSLYFFSDYGTFKTTLSDMERWLLKIQDYESEELDLQYSIIR
jgi:hypothetical protein